MKSFDDKKIRGVVLNTLLVFSISVSMLNLYVICDFHSFPLLRIYVFIALLYKV